MTKICFSLLLLLFLLPYSQSQNVFSKSYDFNEDEDFGTSILQWEEDFIIYVPSICDQRNMICDNLMKLDGNGEILWKQTLNKHGYLSDLGQSLIALHENNLLTGYTAEEANGKQYIELRIVNPDGDSIWGAQIKREENLILTSLMVTDQGNIIGAGDWYDRRVRRSTFLYLFKIDTDGKIIWEHKINPKQFNVIAPTELVPLPNEEFLMTSFYCEKNWRCGEFGDQVYRMDANGEIIWEKPFNNMEDFPNPKVIVLDNKNIAVSYKWGSDKGTGTVAPPPCVQVMNEKGDSLYEYCFETLIGYDINDIYKAKNGDILGCGKKFTRETVHAWIFRLSPECELLWERNILYDINPYMKEIFEGELFGIIDDEDGIIYATGQVIDTFVDHIPALESTNIWLLKLSPDGCLLEGCTEDIQYVSDFLTATKEVSNSNEQRATVSVYPNPSSDIFNILATSEFKMLKLSVYNMNGEELESKQMTPAVHGQIDLQAYAKGTYLLRIIFENGENYVTKLLKH